jgi:hypothetical protein
MYPTEVLLEVARTYEHLATLYRQLAAADLPALELPAPLPVPPGPQQARVVAYLRTGGPQTAAAIAAHLGDKDPARANTSEKLRRLRAAGYVRRDDGVWPPLWQAVDG